MDQRLHDHIIFLEERIQAICDQLTSPHLSSQERERCEAKLLVAETALAHYRSTFNLERELR